MERGGNKDKDQFFCRESSQSCSWFKPRVLFVPSLWQWLAKKHGTKKSIPEKSMNHKIP